MGGIWGSYYNIPKAIFYLLEGDYMGDCQNYGPFLGPYYNTGPNTGPNLGDPKRDHNFDNPPYLLSNCHQLGLLRCSCKA